MSTSNVSAQVGQPVDLAEFAQLCWWEGEGATLQAHPVERDAQGCLRPHRDAQTGEWHLGLEWEAPRDVRRVVVRAAAGRFPERMRVEYWRRNWPTIAPERLPGARRGWIGRDDPWHGKWQTVRAEQGVEGETCTWFFDPIDLGELRDRGAAERLEQAEDYLARYRRTLKLRVVGSGEEALLLAGMEAYSTAVWREGEIDVWLGCGLEGAAGWSGAEAFNGAITKEQGRPGSVQNERIGRRLQVLYTSAGAGTADSTLITVHSSAYSFTFEAGDLDRGPIYVRDYGAYISWVGAGVSFEAFQEELAGAPRSLYDRVADEPEQSLARALAEIPPLDVCKQAPYGRYLPLGVEAGRQEFALRYNGELFVDKRLLKLSGRDAARLLYPGHLLRYRFGTGDPPDFREGRHATRQSLLDGWLPVVASEWLDREIAYAQTAFVALLDGPMTEPTARRGDEAVVALLRFQIRNTTHGRKRARLWIAIASQEHLLLRTVEAGGAAQEHLSLREAGKRGASLVLASGRVVPDVPVARGWRVDPYDTDEGHPAYLRAVVHTGGRGCLAAVPYAEEGGLSTSIPAAVVYDVDLAGGEAHEIDVIVPFVTLTAEDEWRRAAALDLDAKLAEVVDEWRGYVESGGQMELPETVLSDFHKAVRVHVGISVDKEPANGLYSVPAATWAYGCCANEACWQITMLDQAGHHERAAAYLETYLRTQGQTPLDGRFVSSEGVMQGVDLDEGRPRRSGFSYNLDPGFIMRCLAEHYRYSGDRAWLERIAPHLAAACEFVIRERQATMARAPDRAQVVEWGLLPAGHLEDNPEWRYWFAVNAHTYAGLAAAAGVLAEAGHPEGERFLAEAAAYRADLRRAARRAMARAPVVRLLDGSYVPHMPTRARLRGREWGWFREAAYGALHLLEGGVFEPDESEMTWVLQDLEDNLYVSREWGRPVDLEKQWFSHGGVTIQPNLQDLGIDYLRRGQVKHALRALFNNFGSSLYPDVRVFAEHPVVELGHGVGPFYKPSDEAKSLVWLRAFLLHEEGQTLHLAMGAPRAWFEGRPEGSPQGFGVRGMASFFGPVSYRVEPGATGVRVRVELDEARKPKELVVHVRDPERRAIRRVRADGIAHADFAGEKVRFASPPALLEVEVGYD